MGAGKVSNARGGVRPANLDAEAGAEGRKC